MPPLPDQFIQRLQLIIPLRAWDSVLNSFAVRKPLVVRINTCHYPIEEVIHQLEQLEVPFLRPNWKPDTCIFPADYRDKILNSPQYRQGMLYSQNLSSQLVPLVLDPQPEEEILDMCAAPGGKTSQIACMMQGGGRLAAVEKVKPRFFKLQATLKTLQINSVHTYLTDATRLWRKTPERFDRILLDAPCSSESRFRTDKPESFAHWTLKKVRETSRKQRKLIFSAVQCLKPGGILVYSTCSFAPEENEAVIDYILKKFPNQLQLQAITLPVTSIQEGLLEWGNKHFDSSLTKSLRILPDELLDGFYICKIKKIAPTIATG